MKDGASSSGAVPPPLKANSFGPRRLALSAESSVLRTAFQLAPLSLSADKEAAGCIPASELHRNPEERLGEGNFGA